MQITPLSISGAWQLKPPQYLDDRGSFFEWFRQDVLSEHVGHALDLKQVNCSTSKAGVIRGIHFADIPPSQAKYVMCASGAVLDVVVDLRVGSPTYRTWDAVLLDDVDRTAVYLAEGLGHGFMALSDFATVLYLCSAPFAPQREHGVDPFDAQIGIDWPTVDQDGRPLSALLSPKDSNQPSLAEAEVANLLPTFDEAEDFYRSLRS